MQWMLSDDGKEQSLASDDLAAKVEKRSIAYRDPR